MKVAEKETDRHAWATVHTAGKIRDLEEYGEYIDPTDNAICCYVPVEIGDQVEIKGRFSGTALGVSYDGVVDGVIRNVGQYKSKAVQHHASKKLDCQKFLFKTKDGTLDTSILVDKRFGENIRVQTRPETIGTLELRLWVMRQLSVTCNLEDDLTYIDASEEDVDVNEMTTYMRIAPGFCMTFQKDAAFLDQGKKNRELKKLNDKRPGSEPWAIFRFHYRSMESILEEKLPRTRDPLSKAKSEPRYLSLEPVTPLNVGAKPFNDDGDVSTPASSVVPSDSFSSPIKDIQARQQTQIPEPSIGTAKSRVAVIPTARRASVSISEDDNTLFVSETKKPKSKSIATKPGINQSAQSLPQAEGTSMNGWRAFTSSSAHDNRTPISRLAKMADTDSHEPPDSSISDAAKLAKETQNLTKPLGNGTSSPGFGQSNKPGEKRTVINSDNTLRRENIATTGDVPTNGNQTTVATTASGYKAITPSVQKKKTSPKPPPLTIIEAFVPNAVAVQGSVKTPAKRPAEFGTETTQVPKHYKSTATPVAPEPTIITSTVTPLNTLLTPVTPSPVPASISTPRTRGLERLVAEQRKKLDALRARRQDMAKKQGELNKKMEPYKKRMEEELERLNKEMAEEEAAAAEEEEQFEVGMAILAEFEGSDNGN